MKIRIKGPEYCGYTQKIRVLAETISNDIEYDDGSARASNFLPSEDHYPKVWFDDVYIGGYDDFIERFLF